jgi:DNA-binding MarR family transcriptional regulator
VEFTTDKGNTVQGYRISEEPILYTYNKAKKHLLYIPFEMLDTSGYTSDSENVAEFKGYLMQQIQLMKNALEEEKENKNKKGKKGRFFKRSNIILLDTIYKDTGIQTPEERITGKEYKSETIRQREIRRFRQVDRQKIEGLLDAWKAKGWINGYTVLNDKNEPVKERQQAKGYSISI